MLAIADRVQETTNAAGTGSIVLQGATTGYRSFAAAYTTGTTVPYVISYGSLFEVGEGTLTSGTPWSLSRDVVNCSSSSGEKISVTAGMFVFVDATKSYLDSTISTLTTAAVSEAVNTIAPVEGYVDNYNLPLMQYTINKQIKEVVIPDLLLDHIIFDGSFLWCSSTIDEKVYKINSITGAITSVAFEINANPRGLAFDGQNIWVSKLSHATISKINAITNQVSNITLASTLSRDCAFDGSYIYVLRDTSVDRINIVSHAITTISAVVASYNIAFDGSYMWITQGTSRKIVLVNTTTFTLDYTLTLPVGSNPRDIAFDGEYMWVAQDGLTILKLDISTHAVVNTIILPLGDTTQLINSITFDGFNMWVISDQGYIFKIDVLSGELRTITFSDYPNSVTSSCFTGNHLWFTAVDKLLKISKYY